MIYVFLGSFTSVKLCLGVFWYIQLVLTLGRITKVKISFSISRRLLVALNHFGLFTLIFGMFR